MLKKILITCLICLIPSIALAVRADTTVYSSTGDGYISAFGASSWAATRNATAGAASTGDSSYALATASGWTDFFSSYYINRAFFTFSVSSLSGVVRSATIGIYRNDAAYTDQRAVKLYKGTQADPIVNGDFDSFVSTKLYGTTADWDTPDTEAYRTVTLNQTAIHDIQAVIGSGSFKVCARNYYDYQNSAPAGYDQGEGMYFSDNTGTTKDPYILLTFGGLTIDETTDILKHNNQILANDCGVFALPLSGTYDFGTLTHVEGQIFRRDTGDTVQISGNDWNTLTSETISSPNWSGTFTIPVVDAPLGIRVRSADNHVYTGETLNTIHIGYVFDVSGQSYPDYWFDFLPYTTPVTTDTCDSVVKMYRYVATMKSGTYTADTWTTVTGDGGITLGNYLHDTLGAPIGFIDDGMSGSSLLEVNCFGGAYGYWLGTSGVYNCYEVFYSDLIHGCPQSGKKVNGIIWYQAFSDACKGESQADYYDGLGTLFGKFQTDTNYSTVPIFIVGQPRINSEYCTGTDQNISDIRAAQIQKAYDSSSDNYYYAGSTIDFSLYSDGIHQDGQGQIDTCNRIGQVISEQMLGNTIARAPSMSYLVVDTTHTDIKLVHGAGTDFTPTTNITGFEVYTGSWISATGARQDANTIRLTHSAGTVSNVRHCFGKNPTVTSIAKDNSTFTLPLEPRSSIPVYVPPASSQVITILTQ